MSFYVSAGRWNEEVERAQQELKKTRKGLDDIQENILLLEKIIEKDQACLKVLSRIKQVPLLFFKFYTMKLMSEYSYTFFLFCRQSHKRL